MRIPRPTYGSVTATIALFAALAGTSYAAVTISGSNIKNGTLTGADLKNESVKGSDIDNGSLTGSDLKSGSVTSSDIADGSLLGADLKAGQLVAGPVGPQGPVGTTEVLSRRVAEVPLLEGERKEVIARCLPGEVAVGGGAVHDGTVSDLVSIAYSYPLEADDSPPEDGERATAWLAGGHNLFISGVDRKMTVYVLCANA
jgi:hypothetical protein